MWRLFFFLHINHVIIIEKFVYHARANLFAQCLAVLQPNELTPQQAQTIVELCVTLIKDFEERRQRRYGPHLRSLLCTCNPFWVKSSCISAKSHWAVFSD